MAASKKKFGNQLKPKTANPMMKDLQNRMPKPASASSSGASAIGKAATTPAAKSTTPKAAPNVTGNKASSFMNKGATKSLAAKPSAGAKFNPNAPKVKLNNSVELSDFDLVLEHLIDSGFGPDEALAFMVNMTEEKREEIIENRRAARSAGGYKDDSKKQTDPSKDGFTGISGSIKDIMKQSAAMDKKKSQKTQKEGVEDNFNRQGDKDVARTKKWMDKKGMSGAPGLDAMAARKKEHEEGRGKKKTRKEEDESLYQAYLSMMSEEGSDKRKDSDLERKGTDARTDYSKPPGAANEWGKKKPMSDEERSAAMAKVVADLKKKGGK